MGNFCRLVTGFGVIGLGLCTALPFRRAIPLKLAHVPQQAERDARFVTDLPLQVPVPRPPVAVTSPAEPPSADTSGRVPAAEPTGPVTGTWAAERAAPPAAGPFAAWPDTATSSPSAPDTPREPTPSEPSMPDRYEPLFQGPADRRPDVAPQSFVARPQLPATTLPARRHTIRDGDTLAALARRYYGSETRSHTIYAANREVLRDPNLLPIGVEIIIPRDDGGAEAAPQSGAVWQGDWTTAESNDPAGDLGQNLVPLPSEPFEQQRPVRRQPAPEW